MAIISKTQSTNQLKVNPTVITRGQAWRHQIRGNYSILYPYAMGDFAHIKDVKQWIRDEFKAHKHIDSKGGPTTPPLPGKLPSIANIQARKLLQGNPIVSYIRKLANIITDIARINS